MRTLIIPLFFCLNLSGQNLPQKKSEKSLIEAGTFINFNKFKTEQSPGIYAGYWYRYPVDETHTRLELGTSFGYSNSFYQFNYGKDGILYPIRSEEFIWNIGAKMIKEYSLKNNSIEWVSELSLHSLFFNAGDIPRDEGPKTNSENKNSIHIDTNTSSFSSLKIGQGIRFWQNKIGIGMQVSYLPYRLWYRHTAPEGFNSFSVEASLLFKF